MAKWSLGYIRWILRRDAGSLSRRLEFGIMTGFMIKRLRRVGHKGYTCHTGAASRTRSA